MNKEAYLRGYKEAGIIPKRFKAPGRIDNALTKTRQQMSKVPYTIDQFDGSVNKSPKRVHLENRFNKLEGMKNKMDNRINSRVKALSATPGQAALGAGVGIGFMEGYPAKFWEWLNSLLAQNRLDPKFDQEQGSE